MDQMRCADKFAFLLDSFPKAGKEMHIRPEFSFSLAFCRCAYDHAHLVFFCDVFERVFQPRPLLFIFNAPGYANIVYAGHQNQRASRQSDVGCDTGSFGADGLLYDLHHHFLPGFYDILDIEGGRLNVVLFSMECKVRAVNLDIPGIEESIPLKADIHKCRLHSREDVLYLSLINVANKALVPPALDIDFAWRTVFKQYNPCLIWVDVNNDLFFHGSTLLMQHDIRLPGFLS